jgi:hypothetical protein
MKIQDIRWMPTVIDNRHESLYRSYHLLEKVKEMITRGDSKETILEAIALMEDLRHEAKD